MKAKNSRRSRPGRPPDPEMKRRRRGDLLRQAALHFARDGYAKTDIAAIARDAGCAKGTVYNYFSSKRDLFQKVVDHVMNSLLETLDAVEDADPVEHFKQSIEAFLAFFDAHPEYIELLILERAEFRDRKKPTYLEYREAHRVEKRARLERTILSGLFRRVPIDQTLDMVGDLLYGTIFTNYFAGRTTGLERQAANIADILLHGLLRPEARTG
ncbi:TetR/AcrR family transcriptional regulator [Desulfohalovibrio reitneri]|uniref:TetR/AcrR family transcriptional regulator n=1 Tax=Desulfohalovibrio reitneri TaxID=1307759 RepID=UPI0004A7836E|nr:TetR/AcrR family transcriptional regulator [Desulfohalovibrio reitneri]